MLVDAIQLVGCIVHMQGSGPFADTEEIAHLPGRLAFHRPAQRFQFPRSQGRRVR